MTKLYDGNKLVKITMREWDNRTNEATSDWSNDFFEVGGLEYDGEHDAYRVDDVDYCIDMADDWAKASGDFHDDDVPEYIERQVFIDEINCNAKKEEAAVENRNFEIKAKIVRAGNSKIFNSWHDQAGVTEEEFIEGLRWLCDDPMPDGRLTRELGCMRRAASGYSSEQLEIIGGPIAEYKGVGLHRLTRAYYANGEFRGFYDESGRSWGGTTDFASISCHDRI